MTTIEIGEDISVRRGGDVVEMPKSRKTRALFAYLIFHDGMTSRERLCEMFWDQAADPRGGVRWALAKIRKALGPQDEWLQARRDGIGMTVPSAALIIDRKVGERLLALTTSGDHDDYALWLTALRERLLDQAEKEAAHDPDNAPVKQVIRYTRAMDGTRIAYASMGEGPPVLKAANWLSHLEAELDVPVWSGLYRRLAQNYQLHRYDERGNGLSDWDADIDFEAFVSDLECVADAIGLERFPLIGISQGGAVSIEYAARHPERVSALILIGAYPAGWRLHSDPEVRRRKEAEVTLVQTGWGENTPAYRQIFSHSFLPEASSEDIDKFNEFQKQTTSAENAARFIDSFGDIDVRDRLEHLRAPTLVLHSRDDQRIAMKVGAELAATIRGARFETLPTANHVPLAHEPAFAKMMSAIDDFLAEVVPKNSG